MSVDLVFLMNVIIVVAYFLNTSVNLVFSELHCREVAEHAAVKALSAQLHSLQESKDLQQPVRDLDQRLSETSSDIVAKERELASLEAEHQKLMSTNDDDLSDKIERKRYCTRYFICSVVTGSM